MDMKQILHRFVNAQSAPIGGTDDIKKLIGIINEGANHNVSLSVQMAMQHYSEPTKKLSQKPSMLRRYFVEAEESIEADGEPPVRLCSKTEQRTRVPIFS